ncbi:hypothetical protein [Chlorogloeopsis sp. ULAP02]|uniref:hypothetical protein n=1 Tax=Chlorogloeopsis sp. ULAP02 TaxID=3107926 RepID=UPI003134F34D
MKTAISILSNWEKFGFGDRPEATAHHLVTRLNLVTKTRASGSYRNLIFNEQPHQTQRAQSYEIGISRRG